MLTPQAEEEQARRRAEANEQKARELEQAREREAAAKEKARQDLLAKVGIGVATQH